MATGPPSSGSDLDDLVDAFNNRCKKEELEAAKLLFLLYVKPVAENGAGTSDSQANNIARIHGPHDLPPKQKKKKSLQYNRRKKEELETSKSLLLLSVKPVAENGAGTSDSQANNIARIHGPHDLHLLPDQVRKRIESLNGTEITFVTQKTLSNSDLNRNQNRLSFNVNNVQNEFLKQKEVDQATRGLEVTVIQPCLEITQNVELRKRSKNDGRYSEFVLIGNWFQIAENKKNGLKEKKLVRLWSFRMGSDLGFALVKA